MACNALRQHHQLQLIEAKTQGKTVYDRVRLEIGENFSGPGRKTKAKSGRVARSLFARTQKGHRKTFLKALAGVVELDGGQHAEGATAAADIRRSEAWASGGFRVMRFWNADVFADLEGVVDMIRNACGLETSFEYREAGGGMTPTSDPSPQGGGD